MDADDARGMCIAQLHLSVWGGVLGRWIVGISYCREGIEVWLCVELAYTPVVHVGAPHPTFEELFGEGYAMFGFAVSCVPEVGNNVIELNVCARVKEICQGVRSLVWRGYVYMAFSFSL